MNEGFSPKYENGKNKEGLNHKTIPSFLTAENQVREQFIRYQDREGSRDLAIKQVNENNNLREGLETQVQKETREHLDKEAMINEARTMLYEKLGIDNNQNNNNALENFEKGIVDTLILDNYDLAIQIWETNGKIILDSLKQLASWEGLKKVAESIGESIWNLLSGNAYERGKSVAELGLITTGVGAGAFVGRKAFKFGLKEIARLRKPAERVVESTEVKGVIGQVNSRVSEIVPKKQLDFEKALVKDIAKLGDKERLEAASFYLKKKLTPEQEKAIIEAHNVGLPNKDGKFDIGDLRKKYIILEKAGFNDNEIRLLMEKGVCGKDKLPDINSLYSHPKYSFLEKYKEVIGEKLSLDDIVGEGSQAIIIRHPKNERLVVKIAKPGEVDDIMQEFKNHSLFYSKVKELKRQGLIDNQVKVPYVIKGEKDGYFFMEKVDGQSLYSKALTDRFSSRLTSEELQELGLLGDKQVREFLKKRFNESDSYLDQLIEDYSADYLGDLLGVGYKYRKETGKVGGTSLDKAIKILRENGISHNDLHPGNVMIDRNGNIYMIDFGRIKEFNK